MAAIHILRTASLTLALAFSFAPPMETRAAEALKLSSGVSPMKNLISKVREPFAKETGIQLEQFGNPDGNGSDQVFIDVDSGKVDFGVGGVDWESWLKLMKEKGYAPKNADKITQRVVGNDRIRIMTNPQIGVKTLTSLQIAALLNGSIESWKEVGGADVPVRLVVSKTQPATQKFMEEHLMHGKPMTQKGTLVTAQNDEMVAKIASTPGAFGFGPQNALTDQVATPEHPTIGRPLTLITLGRPKDGVLKLIAFIRKEGPKLGL